jgi:hypothetical protein
VPEERHESQEPSLRGLSVAGLVLISAIIAAVAICLGLMSVFGGFSRPLARAEHTTMPEPRLQPHPLADRARYEAQQRAILTRYTWVDRGAEIVRIPVERAMQILAERGRPGGLAGAPGSAAPASARVPGPASAPTPAPRSKERISP